MSQKFSATLYYLAWAIGSLLYTGITLLSPLQPGSNTYHLSLTQIHLLQVTIILPVVAIWLAATYGAVSFRKYAAGINSSPDGAALQSVSLGLILLVARIITSSLVDSLRPVASRMGWFPAWTIATRYVIILLTLVSFYLIFQGARRLYLTLQNPPSIRATKWVALVAVCAATVTYVWALLQNPYRNFSSDALNQSFYLPDWAIMLSVVLIFALCWYLGFMAVAYLRAYSRYTKGVLYQRALMPSALGVGAVVVFSIALQLLGAVAPALRSFRLGGILLLLYILIIFYGIGYGLIAYGARRLQMIEEVKG